MVDRRLAIMLPAADKLTGLYFNVVQDGKVLLEEETKSPIRLRTIDAVRLIISLAQEAETDLKQYKPRGGSHAFRAKFHKSKKQIFAERCSHVWFLSGKSFGRGARADLLRFTHLAYEAVTGEEEGKGLRDLVVKAQQVT